MGAYLKLMAIIESTEHRARPLEVEVRGREGDFVLAVVERKKVRTKKGDRWRVERTLATAPFEPGDQDNAALDVARQLTMDGSLPRGLDE